MTRRERVDAELRAERSAGIGIALAEDAITIAVLTPTLPDHDEVAGGVRGYGRTSLNAKRACRERVHAELRADRGAGTDEALAEDAIARAVLIQALPDDHETAGGTGGDGRSALIVCRVGVDAELGAERVAGD